MAELHAQKYSTNEPVCANLEFEVINTGFLKEYSKSDKQTDLTGTIYLPYRKEVRIILITTAEVPKRKC